jgi:hypothetical protein
MTSKHLQRNSRAELARRWGWHPSRVTRLFQADGAPPFDAAGRIAVKTAEKWRDERIEARAAGGFWRREIYRLQAALLEIQLAETAAGLIPVADVLAQAKIDAALITGSLRAMPDTLAPQIIGLTSAAAVAAVLKSWARSTLQSWSDTVTKGDQNELL